MLPHPTYDLRRLATTKEGKQSHNYKEIRVSIWSAEATQRTFCAAIKRANKNNFVDRIAGSVLSLNQLPDLEFRWEQYQES